MQSILSNILEALDLEKGIIYTITTLTIRPGKAIKVFLFEDRTRLTKPLRFLILTVAVTTFILFKIIPELPNTDGLNFIPLDSLPDQFKAHGEKLNTFIVQYFNLFQLLKIPFFSLATWWLFKKNNYNFAEHLVINAYIYSYQNIYLAILLPILMMTPELVVALLTLVTFGYMSFVFVQVFDESPIRSFLKSLASYFIGNFLHTIFMLIVIVLLYIMGWI